MKKTVFCLGKKENYLNYFNALQNCGTNPVFSEDIQNSHECDALLLLGGDDVNPKLYSQKNTASNGINDEKDKLELELIKIFSELNKPILGICRGHQILNIYFGGDLIQHIDTAPSHSRKIEEPDKIHMVNTTTNNILTKLYGSSFYVNSSHHQAVKNIANELVVLACAEDGVIEALEHKSKPILGVQWHPERMFKEFYTNNNVDMSLLFKHFISLA